MQTEHSSNSRMRRTVNDLVLTEMFLVQATIESATAIGEGLNALGRNLSSEDEQAKSWNAISKVLSQTADDAFEAYTSRYRYLRDLRDSEE
ncbi:MAG: hypothetical protein AAGA91_00765 [Pseudomonadota bacterium]